MACPSVVRIKGTGAAQPHPEPGWLPPSRTHARRGPSRGDGLTGRPKPNLALKLKWCQHWGMLSRSYAALGEMQEFVVCRIRIGRIDTQLMWLALLIREVPKQTKGYSLQINKAYQIVLGLIRHAIAKASIRPFNNSDTIALAQREEATRWSLRAGVLVGSETLFYHNCKPYTFSVIT